MDIDILAEAACRGITTATAMISASGSPRYDRYSGEDTLQSYNFKFPHEPVPSALLDCPHMGGEHVVIELGLEDRLPEHYAVANIFVGAHDVSSYEASGLTVDTVYTLDMYFWRDMESPASIERKLIVVAQQILRAFKAADLEWELHPQQVEWALGESASGRSDSYRLARFSISTGAYVEP